jgi:hypothetical protein
MDMTILRIVRNTLDKIHVQGKDDISAMLGCMNALDEFIRAADMANATPESEVKNDG